MASLRKLISTLDSLEDDLAICMRCGMCQSVCPLYRETRLETDVARGKLTILDGLRRELLDNPDGVARRLRRCLLCGSCQARCPSGVKSVEIFLKARIIISEYNGLSPIKRLILRKILAVPRRFHRILNIFARCQKFFLTETDPVTETSRTRIFLPLIGKRHIKPLATIPFRERVPSIYQPPRTDAPMVAVFVGCLIDRVFPSVAESMLTVLNSIGAGIYMPLEQGCCGMPVLASGDGVAFQSLLRQNIDVFSRKRFDLLITACATCTAVIKEIWPVMAAVECPDLLKKVRDVSEKTMDITEFLVKYGHLDKTSETAYSERLKVTYHDPCHLRKTLGIWKEPRKILNLLDTYEFVEMPDANGCCGLGGSFGLEYDNLSERIGLRKVRNIVASGADVVATACPACMIQLADMLSRTGNSKLVKHVVELYAGELQC